MSLEEREKKRRKSIVGDMLNIEKEEEEEKKESNIDEIKPLIITIEQKERKSKRANFLLKPSVYEKAKNKADKLDVSMNEIVNLLLEAWINEQ